MCSVLGVNALWVACLQRPPCTGRLLLQQRPLVSLSQAGGSTYRGAPAGACMLQACERVSAGGAAIMGTSILPRSPLALHACSNDQRSIGSCPPNRVTRASQARDSRYAALTVVVVIHVL